MKTYEKDNLYKIFITSSEDMSMIAENSVGFTVTSPPYYTMKGYVKYDSYEHYLSVMETVFKEILRVTKPGRYFACNCCDYILNEFKYSIPADLIKTGQKAGWTYRDDIIWSKSAGVGCGANGGGAKRAGNFIKYGLPTYYRPNNTYEHIIIFQKGNESFHLDEEKLIKYKLDWSKYKEVLGDVWYFNTVPQGNHSANLSGIQHPCEFPDTLPEKLIELYSLPGEIVLEPFLGSATTIIVAVKLGRIGYGFEICEDYLPLIESKLGIKNASLSSFNTPKDKEIV